MHLSGKGQRSITVARWLIWVTAGLLALTSLISWNAAAFIGATALVIGNAAIGRLQRDTSDGRGPSPSDHDTAPDR